MLVDLYARSTCSSSFNYLSGRGTDFDLWTSAEACVAGKFTKPRIAVVAATLSHPRRDEWCSCWTRFELGDVPRVGLTLAENSLSYIPASWVMAKRASATEANRRCMVSWWLTVASFQHPGSCQVFRYHGESNLRPCLMGSLSGTEVFR